MPDAPATPDPDATELTPRRAAHQGTTLPHDRAASLTGEGGAIGRYDVTGHLGQGGMGEVLEAFDPSLRRRVALKRSTCGGRELVERFIEEAQVTAQLDHPNIVPVYELSTDAQGQPYYTMKEVRGRTLGELIADGETPLPRLLRICLRICEAVAFAHARGVLHRDLKPANVMVGEFGEVYVLDWGLSAQVGAPNPDFGSAGATGDSRRTEVGMVLGTPAYMSPEQAIGAIDRVDHRSDVYLLGGILFECLTGSAPDASAREHAIEPASQRAPERNVPAELEAIAARALQPSPDQRYASASELAADIEAHLDGRLVSAARYSPAAAAWKWVRRHRYFVAGLVAVLATAASAGGLFALRRSRTRADARRAVVALDPMQRLDLAREIVASLPADPARRRSPDPERKARYAQTLGRLQELAAAQTNWQRTDPDSSEARDGLFATLLALGRLALVSEDYALAEFALGQAASLDPSSARARELKASVASERKVAIARHKLAADRVIAHAIRTDLRRDDEQAYRRAMALLLRWREPETIAHLRGRLSELTALLQAAACEAILVANEITETERATGLKPLADLPNAARVWLAWVGPPTGPTPSPTPEQRRQVSEALLRLELRARRSLTAGARGRTRQALLVEAQTRALRRDGRDRAIEIALLCDALGTLDYSRRNAVALLRQLGAEWDSTRALPSGLALAALAGNWPALETLLGGLVGLKLREDRPGRWGLNGNWWRQVSRELRRHGLAESQRDPAAAPQTAAEFNRQGAARAARGDPDGAIRDFSRAIALDPKLAMAYSNRGLAREASGQLAGAIADYTRAIALEPRFAQAYCNRGSLRLLQDDPAGAILDQTRAIALNPNYVGAYSNRGLAREASGDLDGAISDYTRAIALDPGDVRPHVNRGSARLAKGDLPGSIADSTRAIALDPKHSAAHVNRAIARAAQGDTDGAIVDFTRAIALDPKIARAYDNRGLERQAKGDLAGALADHARAIALDPQYAKAFNNRGLVRRATGDLDGAIVDFTRALALDPKLAEVHVNRGIVRQAKGDLDGAIADQTRAIALNPKLAIAYTNRGRARGAKGEHDAAIADHGRAIALRPKNPKAYNSRGVARLDKGDLEGAFTDLTRAIALDPKFADAYTNRGNMRERSGDYSGAIVDHTRAIALDPKFAKAYGNRGSAHQAKGDQVRAIADYTRAIALDPKLVMAHNNRGLSRQAQGDLNGALADYKQALALNPRFWAAWANLGILHARKGQLKKAVAALRKGHALAPARVKPQIAALLRKISGR